MSSPFSDSPSPFSMSGMGVFEDSRAGDRLVSVRGDRAKRVLTKAALPERAAFSMAPGLVRSQTGKILSQMKTFKPGAQIDFSAGQLRVSQPLVGRKRSSELELMPVQARALKSREKFAAQTRPMVSPFEDPEDIREESEAFGSFGVFGAEETKSEPGTFDKLFSFLDTNAEKIIGVVDRFRDARRASKESRQQDMTQLFNQQRAVDQQIAMQAGGGVPAFPATLPPQPGMDTTTALLIGGGAIVAIGAIVLLSRR